MRNALSEDVKWHEGLPWPETTHSILLDIDPMNAAAIFSDANSHKDFIPQILRSEIREMVSPNEYRVFYKLKVPFPLFSTTYTNGNIIETLPDGSFCIRWYHIEAEESRDMRGSAIFSRQDGRTLLTYNNLVVPNNSLAGLFAQKAVKDIGETVITIAKYLNSHQNELCPNLERRRISFLGKLEGAGAA